jgi:hypothetical protein
MGRKSGLVAKYDIDEKSEEKYFDLKAKQRLSVDISFRWLLL